MTDVVDSDELLRRMQRARAYARREERVWQARSNELEHADPAGARDAAVRTIAYESVINVLDEFLSPGSHAEDG